MSSRRNKKRACLALATLAAVIASSVKRAEPASDQGLIFPYFAGNGEDGLHLAWSEDGLEWTTLRAGGSCLAATVGGDRLMRDPSIVQGPDGTFHMVWTSSWTDRIIGYAHSKNLIEWSPQRAIPVMMHEPKARNSWAPELFFDRASGEFWIIWSTTIPGQFARTVSSKDLKTWTDVTDRLRFPKGARHGTVLKVSRNVLDILRAHFDGPAARPSGELPR